MTIFLPGVPESLVREAFARAGGNEIATGKFASAQSSAALAANAVGWFLERPAALPPFPGLNDLDWPVANVSLEREMRFPWSGGRHSWLDAAVETPAHLIGVESKRFEPFRSNKPAKLALGANHVPSPECSATRQARLRPRHRGAPDRESADLVLSLRRAAVGQPAPA